MRMKVKDVKYIRDGEILASPIYTEDKNILIPKGTVLKREYSDLLISLDIEYIEIEDSSCSYVSSVPLISENIEKDYIAQIKKLLENHIYAGKNSLKKSVAMAEEIWDYVKHMNLDCVYDIVIQNPNLYEHTLRVTVLSLIIARKMNLSEEQCKNIAIGCILHDLGLRYITVPFMNKEFEQEDPADAFEYKKHTILAYTVLEGEDWLPAISRIMILSHHEKKNGSGFPLKQKKQELECRIIQFCDSFDCLISGIGCKRHSIDEAMSFFLSDNEKQYDKNMTEILFPLIAKYPAGTEVELSDGRYAIVCRQSGQMDRPVIVMLTKLDGEAILQEEYNLEEKESIQIRKVV